MVNSTVLGRKSSRTGILILASSSAILFKAVESLKITSRKIGSVDILKKETLLIYFSIIMKAAKRNTIKLLKLSTKKEATGSIIKSNSLTGSSLTKKSKKSSAPLPILKSKLFNKENSKYSKKYNKISSAKTITCQAQLR